ncbi:MAG: Lrp/AsnC ligand binding domain-containing protein [Euryarchaeota archaeon]|jgi:DNA-binding Lrp family transcriptional regulator|nr:Lrp/AsnC ligand binding domain-containing protein [Euryarchaeota archaeon]
MAIGFVLITTLPGKEQEVRDKLDGIELVTSRWMLFGEYDLIARVHSDDEFSLTKCIVEEIRTIEGIADTKTLLGAEL